MIWIRRLLLTYTLFVEQDCVLLAFVHAWPFAGSCGAVSRLRCALRYMGLASLLHPEQRTFPRFPKRRQWRAACCFFASLSGLNYVRVLRSRDKCFIVKQDHWCGRCGRHSRRNREPPSPVPVGFCVYFHHQQRRRNHRASKAQTEQSGEPNYLSPYAILYQITSRGSFVDHDFIGYNSYR